jgi:integrase
MATSWILVWEDGEGESYVKRYRVRYRLGGQNSKQHYGGSFRTRREAMLRKQFIDGEFAAGRVPNINLAAPEAQQRTLAEAAERYCSTRVDAADNTKVNMAVALNMVVRALGRDRRVDQVTSQNIADTITTLTDAGYKRETIRKAIVYLAATFDLEGIDPNPARDKLRVRLPRGETVEPTPPTADHVEAVHHLLPSKHRLALLWLDWSGARVSSIDHTLVGDYDEPLRRVRLRAARTKTGRALWVDLHPVLAEAIEAMLPPREDRDLDARLFADSGSDALRTAIAKACKAAGVPLFSPHDLRHRRISLLHRQGRTWAEIGALVGQRSLRVTADTYTHVLVDPRELDLAGLLEA